MPRDDVIVYKDKAGEWRWRREASNGRNVGNSGEGYKNKWYTQLVARVRNPGARLVLEIEKRT